MTDKKEVMDKIHQVVAAAHQFQEDQFKTVFGGLIRKGGKEAELQMVKFITANQYPLEARLNFIAAAAAVQSPLFLVPLKKVIDQEPDLNLKKAAVAAIAAYSNQQALNILNAALNSVGNPYLQKNIQLQIDQVKKDNPVLALMPRFLKMGSDKKAYMVMMNLMKKNMTPPDTVLFVHCLKSNAFSVRTGAFELVCTIGDRTIQNSIFEFFFNRAEKLVDAAEGSTESLEMNSLVTSLKAYLLRFTILIVPQLPKLTALYPRLKEGKLQRAFIAILCHCRAPNALAFVKDIYENGDADIREYVIEESAGNDQAVDFLFEKYRAGQSLKEKVVKALLMNQKGFQYFSEHFLTFDPDHQEMIVKNLPDDLSPQMVGFIRTLFKSDLKHLKKLLLNRIRANFLFPFKNILFDPERAAELFAMEEDYLSTITQLFPAHAVSRLLEWASREETGVYQVKDYFSRIQDLQRYDLAIKLSDPDVLPRLINKIILAASPEMLESLFLIFERMKTFDKMTYKNFYDALVVFIEQRGDNVIEEETHTIKRIRENYKNIIDDVKKIDILEKDLKRAVIKTVPDLGALKKLLETYQLGVAFKIDWVCEAISEYFKKSEEKYVPNWREFFKEMPLITQLIKDAGKPKDSGRFQDKLRIILRFQDKIITALFRDQISETLPHYNLYIGDKGLQLESTDILVCDSHSLKQFINENKLTTRRIFALLESRTEFSMFKKYSVRAFLPPISAHKVTKNILSELYLMRG